MPWLELVIRIEVWAFVGALLFAFIAQLASGGIDLSGLIRAKDPATSGARLDVSPARVQLLLFTLAAAFLLLVRVINGETSQLDFPPEFDAAFGGSATAYLGLKGWQVTELRKKREKGEGK